MHKLTHLQPVQVVAVLVDDGGSVVHHAVARHHPGAGADVGHGGGEVQALRRVECDANLDGARPLVHHLVQAHLKHLAVTQRSGGHHHAVVEVVDGAEQSKNSAFFLCKQIFFEHTLQLHLNLDFLCKEMLFEYTLQLNLICVFSS